MRVLEARSFDCATKPAAYADGMCDHRKRYSGDAGLEYATAGRREVPQIMPALTLFLPLADLPILETIHR